jgi:hypothetical protein
MVALQTNQAFAVQGSRALEPFGGLTAMPQQIFSATKLPILVIRMDTNVLIYANPAACDVFGLVDQRRDLTIWDIVTDARDRDVLNAQLKKRSEGHNDDYELTFRRLDNRRIVIAKIAGVALTNDAGDLVASLAIVRPINIERATESILKATQRLRGWRRVLEGLSRELVRFLPFDELSVSLVNEKSLLSRVLFRCDCKHAAVPIGQKWYPLTPKAIDRVATGNILIVPNIRDFLVEVDLNHLLDAPDSALARGMRSMISVPIVWGGAY